MIYCIYGFPHFHTSVVIRMLIDLYAKVCMRLSTLHWEDISPGFHRYPFAIYTSSTVCLEGTLMPWTPEFRGNTSIEYDGQRIAIWDIENDPMDDPDLLTSNLVHEMFHCHQHASGHVDWPDDLMLLSLPASPACDALRAEEHRLLREALLGDLPRAFGEFLRIRARRRSSDPALTREEEKVEALEGAAEFAGLRALTALKPDRYHESLSSVLAWLSADDERFFDRRRMAYFTGTAIRLCLAAQGWPTDQLPDAQPSAWPIPPLSEKLCTARQALDAAHRRRMSALLLDSRRVPCHAQLTGYDPMNMFRVDDQLICEHFAILTDETGTISLMSPVVLTLAPVSTNLVVAYHIQ